MLVQVGVLVLEFRDFLVPLRHRGGVRLRLRLGVGPGLFQIGLGAVKGGLAESQLVGEFRFRGGQIGFQGLVDALVFHQRGAGADDGVGQNLYFAVGILLLLGSLIVDHDQADGQPNRDDD